MIIPKCLFGSQVDFSESQWQPPLQFGKVFHGEKNYFHSRVAFWVGKKTSPPTRPPGAFTRVGYVRRSIAQSRTFCPFKSRFRSQNPCSLFRTWAFVRNVAQQTAYKCVWLMKEEKCPKRYHCANRTKTIPFPACKPEKPIMRLCQQTQGFSFFFYSA